MMNVSRYLTQMPLSLIQKFLALPLQPNNENQIHWTVNTGLLLSSRPIWYFFMLYPLPEPCGKTGVYHMHAHHSPDHLTQRPLMYRQLIWAAPVCTGRFNFMHQLIFKYNNVRSILVLYNLKVYNMLNMGRWELIICRSISATPSISVEPVERTKLRLMWKWAQFNS